MTHSLNQFLASITSSIKGKVHRKKVKKTSVSFMYVCVAENVELLVFFYFFFAPSPY